MMKRGVSQVENIYNPIVIKAYDFGDSLIRCEMVFFIWIVKKDILSSSAVSRVGSFHSLSSRNRIYRRTAVKSKTTN